MSPTVELDEIFRSFDEHTRRAFQVWMQSQAQAVHGRGSDLNDAFGNLGPFAETPASWWTSSTASRAPCSSWSRNSGDVFAALSERDGQLRPLIENSNTVFSTTAARDEELQADLHRACRPSSASRAPR